jgi:LmbE family N-acetylglucosaminyl deacetylase
MFSEGKMNVLGVVAHPDDLEFMAGGSVARWLGEGHTVHVLTLTTGVWRSPDGTLMRTEEEAVREGRSAAEMLGYTVEFLRETTMDLRFEDRLVCEVLRRVDALRIDTILCPWEGDLHHDHEVAARIASSASRRVPRVLMGQVNWYLREFFCPNVFVDVTETWQRKIEALRCFKGQWDRVGSEWLRHLDETTRYYGRMVGVERAEGFVSKKLLL